jgi:hypothetical protein
VAATPNREAQEHYRAHGSGGAGYSVPIWPSRSTSWTWTEVPRAFRRGIQ